MGAGTYKGLPDNETELAEYGSFRQDLEHTLSFWPCAQRAKSLFTIYQVCKHRFSRKRYQPHLVAQDNFMSFLYPDIFEKFLLLV